MKRVLGYALMCAPFMLLFALYVVAVMLSVYDIDLRAMFESLSKPDQVAVMVLALPVMLALHVGWVLFTVWSLETGGELTKKGAGER